MRKRIFSLSLAAAMVFLSLAGCSQTGQEAAQAPVQDSTQASTQAETEAPSAPAETAGPDTNYTYADTIAWDGQYDVVVVGFGGAGAVASATAADEGARVLLVEKAPEGHEGGNTRVCGQMFAYGAEDEEGTYEYYQALAGGHSIPEELLRVYTKNVAHMYDVMEELTGIPKSEYFDWTGSILGSMSPEYPEFPNAEKISLNALHEGFSDGFLWQTLRGLVTDRSDKIDVWFESPATHLIQDPQTKTILGVQVERDGNVLTVSSWPPADLKMTRRWWRTIWDFPIMLSAEDFTTQVTACVWPRRWEPTYGIWKPTKESAVWPELLFPFRMSTLQVLPPLPETAALSL